MTIIVDNATKLYLIKLGRACVYYYGISDPGILDLTRRVLQIVQSSVKGLKLFSFADSTKHTAQLE